MVSATISLAKSHSSEAEELDPNSVIDLLTLTLFCQLQEDHITLSLLHVRYQQDV